MKNGDKPCAICNAGHAYHAVGDTANAYLATCPYCGKYQMTIGADFKLTNISTTARQRANMSGWLHENQPYSISEGNLDLLCAIKAPSFHDRADKFLMTLERKTEFAGQKVKMEPSWQSASWSINIEELKELLNYLANERRVDFDGANCKIMPNGWARLDELRKVNADSEQCFVAMWFDDSIVPIYDEVIAKAILDAGYRPHRVDRREHNEKIDDEIIAQIRRSRFIVADFTDHRSGVYYEAGFAKGLGLEVILTCRKDDIENLHFDVRQYNCIDWEASKLPVFMKRLTDRIESVLGSGTYKR